MYVIQRPPDSTVSEDAGIEPGTVATLALTARRLRPIRGIGCNEFTNLTVQARKCENIVYSDSGLYTVFVQKLIFF